MWPIVTAESPLDDRASLHGKGQAMSDRDAGFCSGGEEMESEGAGGVATTGGLGADDADEALSPTDASEDSVEVRVRAVAAPPPVRKRKCPEATSTRPVRKTPTPDAAVQAPVVPTPSTAPPPPKKRRLLPAHVVGGGGGPFRPWSVECCEERLCESVPAEAADSVSERLQVPRGVLRLNDSSKDGHVLCERLPSAQEHCLRIDPSERRFAHMQPRIACEDSDPHRLRVKKEPSSTPGVSEDQSSLRFHFAAAPALRVKPEPPSSSDSRFEPSRRERIKGEAGGEAQREGAFSVAALLGASGAGPASTASTDAAASSSSNPGPSTSSPPQRNYKNMTRERRIEANARERTRVHTISAAFDTLRRAVPAYSHAQKLSKLSVLRVACAYILTLSRAAGKDYSADASQPSLESCVDLVTRTIHTEGKLRRKRDE